MRRTSRGLELTRTEWGSDAQLLFSTVKTAANTESVKLKHQIERGNPDIFLIHAIALAAISEIWFWTHEVSCDYEDTPAVLLAVPKYARHIDEWHENYGPALWWRDPIEEPPYVGTPDDTDFDETYKWWSPIDIPEIPESETHE
ncbi:hypothetical protein M3C92_09195 [Dermabacter hominis]|uniref:hypothetical protein n=1 Tax=Dermabacter hominis TaxID=36740 RepID=UPI0021A313B1|nr:hypothetical protein [Dermabacter hominis]MCT1956390.1 hypothetical protein [Dermabacter hominis]